MAADACQAHAETYMGLVEVGVGLIPAGGGCLRMVERYTTDLLGISGVDLLPFIGQASLNIAMAKVATSAEEAKSLKYLRASDGISLNPARQLYEAKQRALGLAGAGYRAPIPPLLPAAGYDAEKTIGARVLGAGGGRLRLRARRLDRQQGRPHLVRRPGGCRDPAPGTAFLGTWSAKRSSPCAASKRAKSACSSC